MGLYALNLRFQRAFGVQGCRGFDRLLVFNSVRMAPSTFVDDMSRRASARVCLLFHRVGALNPNLSAS